MKAYYKWASMKAFFKWAAGFFEDASGTASRKAAAGYWGLMALSYMIIKDVNGSDVDKEMFLMVISFTAGVYGMVLLERFAKKDQKKEINPEVNPEP